MGNEADDGSLPVGQKSVTTVICWMGMAALRNATRRWVSTAMVSESHSKTCLWSITQFETQDIFSSVISLKTMATPYKL